MIKIKEIVGINPPFFKMAKRRMIFLMKRRKIFLIKNEFSEKKQ